MSINLANFEKLLSEQKRIYTEILKRLNDLIDAGRKRETERIADITNQLIQNEKIAAKYEDEIVSLVSSVSKEMGIEAANFKLSLLDKEGRHTGDLNELRELVRNVAHRAAEAGGILSANVEIIEETVKVLESLDSRIGGYGPEKPIPVSSKMIDRTA